MKSRKFLVTLLSMTAMLFLLLLTTTTQAQTATSFSGNATGVIANATILNTVTANATIAATGDLNPTSAGDRRTAQVAQVDAAATIQLGGILGSNNTLSTGLVQTRTSSGQVGVNFGDPGAGVNTSQSQAVVNNLNLNILAATLFNAGLSVTGDTLTANTNCSCQSGCTGNSQIKNLRVNGMLVGLDIGFAVLNNSGTVTGQFDIFGNLFLTATPNTQISLLNGTLILTLNEQTSTSAGARDITVNALRIQTVNLLGVTTDIIVSQAHSDITCAAAAAGVDLVVTKTATIRGSIITNVITVTNIGSTTATGVVLTDNLPLNTTFFSATQTGTTTLTLTTPQQGFNGTITGTGTLAANETVTITIISVVNSGTTVGTSIPNTATVTSGTTEVNLLNNTSTATVMILAPTAASVSIGGRVLSPVGRGVSRARVLLTDSTGQTRSVMTNPFGYYRFSDVEVGGTYIFEVRDKRYTFTPQTLSLNEGVTNFNFRAQR